MRPYFLIPQVSPSWRLALVAHALDLYCRTRNITHTCFFAFLSLSQILGSVDHRNERNQSARSALDSLHFNFGEVPGVRRHSRPKIALRMTRGPTRSCIAFHCDGAYATSTTQIPLNSPDEYEGGKLCFFMNDKLHFVPRVAGSMVQHPPRILHGVTSVTRGTRKSLFVVDDSNSLGMEGVIEVTSNHVVTFLAARV